MKHKYIFYLYPNLFEKKGTFMIFSRVKDGKEWAGNRPYDYQKIY